MKLRKMKDRIGDLWVKYYPITIQQGVFDEKTDETLDVTLTNIKNDITNKANHGYVLGEGEEPKTLKEVDEEKALHGYSEEEDPKTLKQVDDRLEELSNNWTKEDASKDKMKFFHENGIPTSESDDGMYFVKGNTDTISTYLVSGGEVYPIGDNAFGRVIYGREWLRGGLDPEAVRWIGDEMYKNNNVILDDFKACKMKDGAVDTVLNQVNWFRKADGSPASVVWTESEDDDGTDVMIVNTKGFWYIGGGTNETYERHIVSLVPFVYDGDVAQYIEPFGMSADFAVLKDGVLRCIHDLTTTGTRTTGAGGSDYMMDRGGWPTTSLTRFGGEERARAKNSDTSRNVPYANAFQRDLRVWHSLQIIKYGTKDLHAQDLCGGGISANDSAPNIDNWGKKTGVRFKRDGEYVYYNLNSAPLSNSEGGTTYDFHQVLNNYRPCLQILECQLVLSYANENGIAQDTRFTYEGHEYEYVNIDGSKGIEDGEMTARVRKFFTTLYTGYDNVLKDDVEDLEIEWCLEQPILNGKIGDWGNIFMWQSGIDRIIDGSDGNISYLYQTDDIEKVTTDTETGTFEPPYTFALQETYDLVGTLAYNSAYVSEMQSNSLWAKTKGAGLHTGECAYLYFTGAPTAGMVSRRGVFSRGRAVSTDCASRSLYSTNAPTNSFMNLGVGFRVRPTNTQ